MHFHNYYAGGEEGRPPGRARNPLNSGNLSRQRDPAATDIAMSKDVSLSPPPKKKKKRNCECMFFLNMSSVFVYR